MNQAGVSGPGHPSPLPSIPAQTNDVTRGKEERVTDRSRVPRPVIPKISPYQMYTALPDLSKLSADELNAELTIRFDRLHKIENFSTTESSDDLSYLRLAAKHASSDDKKTTIGQKMSDLNAPELFRNIWSRHFSADDFLIASRRVLYNNMLDILIVMANMTDGSVVLCKHAFRIQLYQDVLSYLESKKLDPSKSQDIRRRAMVLNLMAVLVNLIQKVPNVRQPLRENEAVKTLQRYRSSSDEMTSCKALVLQASLITEEENEQINSDDKTFAFLLRLVQSSLKSEDHFSRAHRMTAAEGIESLNLLSANDNNKSRIVKSGALPCYVKLLDPQCSLEEQVVSTKGLWNLAFKCADDVRKEAGCVEALQSLIKTSRDDTVKRQALGVMWILTGTPNAMHSSMKQSNTATLGAPTKFKDKTESDTGVVKAATPGPASEQHVFISYQWDSKKTVMKIRDTLTAAGYRIWVDFDNMAGSVLEAMAEAVEKSVLVIVCLTQKYKESPNCRTEAEYAFRLQKDVVPLRLQTGYTPDGWLGALIGSKLVHDFSADVNEDTYRDLCRDLGDRGKFITSGSISPPVQATGLDTAKDVAYSKPLRDWTSADVNLWLDNNNLHHMQDWFHDFDGAMINELKTMRRDAPEAFYTLLQDSQLAVVDMLRLNKALTDI